MGGRIPEDVDVGRAGDATDRAGLRSLFQSVRRRRRPEDSGHRSRADARSALRALHGRDFRILRAHARSDEIGMPGRRHRHGRLRPGAMRGRRRARRRGPSLPALREALQQLFERRSLPPLPRLVTRRPAPAGAQDHAPARSRADRGVHRRNRVHGPGGGESRRSRRARRPTLRFSTGFRKAKRSSMRR